MYVPLHEKDQLHVYKIEQKNREIENDVHALKGKFLVQKKLKIFQINTPQVLKCCQFWKCKPILHNICYSNNIKW